MPQSQNTLRAARPATATSAPWRPAARGEAAPRVTLVERAYAEIRRRILDNEYPPSGQVLEHELAANLGMSRTPVWEALVRLQNEMYVQLIPRHGMRVVPLSLEDLRDMYEVLTALELAAIERLSRSRPNKQAIAELQAALDKMDQALRQRDLDAWVRADELFHRRLVDLCGNARLAAMAASVWEQGHRARTATVRLRPALKQSNREHRDVVDAIRRGDWRVAKARHTKHRNRTSTEILNLLDQTRLGRC